MYPATFFGLFPPFPRNNRAFVAMSFETRFDARWKQAIAPGVELINVGDVPLAPHRVDLSKRGDSVLTEILEDISRARIIIADITSLGTLPDGYVVRNHNVLYEVGLAHAMRLPEEVLLFRSDVDPLPFDTSNVRVHRYDPDGNPEGAKRLIAETIMGSLTELELRRHLAVRQAAESLENTSFHVLLQACTTEGISHPSGMTMGEVLGNSRQITAIQRLLDIGAIISHYKEFTPAVLGTIAPGTLSEKYAFIDRYLGTPFGRQILAYAGRQLGLGNPKVSEVLKAFQNQPSHPSAGQPSQPSASANESKDRQ